MILFEDIKFTDEQLQPIVDWCESNVNFSPVITKFNKEQWKKDFANAVDKTIDVFYNKRK